MNFPHLAVQVDGAAVIAQRIVGETGNIISFRAERVREERTGVHGRLAITVDDTLISWSNFNCERDEERVRLANSAYKQFAPLLKQAHPLNYLKHDLDEFCARIWATSLSIYSPEMLEGTLEPRQPELLLDPFVISGGGTIMFAPPGRGKSWLGLLMAVSVDAGVDALFKVKQTNVLVIQIERSRGSQQNRLGDINAALGLDRCRALAFLNARGRSLADVFASAEHYIKDNGTGFVVLDSISRSGFGDLTENRPVNAIIDALNRLCPTWVATAHTPRSDENHVYGSIHFEAGADIVVQLTSQTGADTLGIGLQIVKANDVPLRPMSVYGLRFNECGLTGSWKASPRDFPELSARTKIPPLELAREYLLLVGKADAETIGREIGMARSEVSRMLSNASGFSREKDGRKVLFYVRDDAS